MACSNGIHIATWGDSTSAPAGPVPKARCDCGAFATATPDPRTTTTEGRDEHPIVSSVRSAYWWAGKSIHNVMAWDSEQWEPIEAACEEATESIRQIEQERDALRVDLTRARLERDDARSWSALWKRAAREMRRRLVDKHDVRTLAWHAAEQALAARTAEVERLREASEQMYQAIRQGVQELPSGGLTGGGERPYSETWKAFGRSRKAWEAALAAAPEPAADDARGHRFVPMSGTRDPQTNRYARCSVIGCMLEPEEHPGYAADVPQTATCFGCGIEVGFDAICGLQERCPYCFKADDDATRAGEGG